MVPGVLQHERGEAAFFCHHCGNHCRITRRSAAERVQFLGAVCDRWEDERVAPEAPLPGEDVWARRERLVLHHAKVDPGSVHPAGALGIPRASLTPELLPLWTALARAMGRDPVLSTACTPRTMARGRELISEAACPPLQLAAGQILELVDRGVDHVLVPRLEEEGLEDLGPLIGATLYRPEVRLEGSPATAMVARGAAGPLGLTSGELAAAVQDGIVASHRLRRDLQAAGRDALAAHHPRIAVIIGWPCNLDLLVEAGLVTSLRRHGLPSLPQDCLPLDRVDPALDTSAYCSAQCLDQVRAVTLCAMDDRLIPVLVHNTRCTSDESMGEHLRQIIADRPCLTLDMDEAGSRVALAQRVALFASAGT